MIIGASQEIAVIELKQYQLDCFRKGRALALWGLTSAFFIACIETKVIAFVSWRMTPLPCGMNQAAGCI